MAVCRATGAPCEVINEIRYGGATYVSTGRGLPTDRRPFIGEAVPGKLLIIANDECCTQFIIFCFTHLRSWTTPKPWNPGKGRSNEFEPCWGFSSKSLEGFTSITHPLHTTQLDQKKKRVTGLYRKRKWLSVAVLQNRRVWRVKSDTGVLAAEDGVTLLAGVVLIYLAGGVSGRRCWVSVRSVAHRTLLFMPVVSRACCSSFTSYQISHSINELEVLESLAMTFGGSSFACSSQWLRGCGYLRCKWSRSNQVQLSNWASE